MPRHGLQVTGRARFLTGLIGRDIGATRSPWIHESEADALGIRLAYSPFDFTALGLDEADLPRMLAAARATGFSGLNITHPYKQAIIPHVDALDEAAARIGAVNTVCFSDDRSIGYNTDYLGFLESLRRSVSPARMAHVVQFGAGGAGSATAQAILDHGEGVLTLIDSSASQRNSLIDRLASLYDPRRIRSAPSIADCLADADGVVNATPVGMDLHPGSLVPPALLDARLWIADLVYFPAETELLRSARAAGCDTIDGIDMVVFQAAAAFELFTGIAPNPERMVARIRERLGEGG